MSDKRRDPSISGQEYEIELDETSSVFARVSKSHVNNGYTLTLRDANNGKAMSFERMAEAAYDGEIPEIYTEEDIYAAIDKIFEADGKLEQDDSIAEWDEALEISDDSKIEQRAQVYQELLSGVYSESHIRSGDFLYMRFGNIIVKVESRWVD